MYKIILPIPRRILGFLLVTLAIFIFLSTDSFSHDKIHGSLVLIHPLIKIVPGSPNAALYIEIANEGKLQDRLIGAECDCARKMALHSQIIEDGIAKMRHIDSIIIPPETSIELLPGGYHIMIMGLRGTYENNDTIPVKFTFENQGIISMQALVEYVVTDQNRSSLIGDEKIITKENHIHH
mgnify:CR=1 FL=1|tara:strand:- start:24890 stop:25432 length:543 start_codon:yes stop_codon:yes gene_type:complete